VELVSDEKTVPPLTLLVLTGLKQYFPIKTDNLESKLVYEFDAKIICLCVPSQQKKMVIMATLRFYVKLYVVHGPLLIQSMVRHCAMLGYSSGGGHGGKGETTMHILHISPPILLRILDPCLTYVECNRFSSRIHAECSVHRPLQGGGRFRFK
jgi:hypothetical protein